MKEAQHLLENQSPSWIPFAMPVAFISMRQQQYKAALELFKSLVILFNCTWMRDDLPVIYRTNLITALLLANIPQGAQSYLRSIREQDHPSVLRLKETLSQFVHQLTWSQWLQWQCGLDLDVKADLGFIPGDFFDPLEKSPLKPGPTSKTSDLSHREAA
ncbi:MAG: hypothetical protein R3C11_11065 [Planctomycetaceae bacterium]